MADSQAETDYRPIAEIVGDLRALGIPDEDLAPIVKIACLTCGYGPKPCKESGCPGGETDA